MSLHLWYQALAEGSKAQVTELSPEIPAPGHSPEEQLILRDGKMTLFKELHLLPGPDSQDGFITNTVTIEFADKTVQFINGRLVE